MFQFTDPASQIGDADKRTTTGAEAVQARATSHRGDACEGAATDPEGDAAVLDERELRISNLEPSAEGACCRADLWSRLGSRIEQFSALLWRKYSMTSIIGVQQVSSTIARLGITTLMWSSYFTYASFMSPRAEWFYGGRERP